MTLQERIEAAKLSGPVYIGIDHARDGDTYVESIRQSDGSWLVTDSYTLPRAKEQPNEG